MEFVELKSVYKSYGEQRVLDGLNISIPKGCIFALLGHNGAGKTTTSRIIQGLCPVDGGEVWLNGEQITVYEGKTRSKIGVLCEDSGLYENLTVYENLVFYAKVYQLSKKDYDRKIKDYLEFFELTEQEDQLTSLLSRGMKKKVALIRTLLHDPDLLILDEPLNGLDPIVSDKLCQLIQSLSKDHGKTILLTSHHLKEIEAIIDDYVIIKNGKVVKLPNSIHKNNQYHFLVDVAFQENLLNVLKSYSINGNISNCKTRIECQISELSLVNNIVKKAIDQQIPLKGFFPVQVSLKELYQTYGI